MALSPNAQNPARSGFQPAKSYTFNAKTRFATAKHSLISNESTKSKEQQTPTTNGEEEAIKICKSSVWRHARSKNCLLLEISKLQNLTDRQHLRNIFYQYGGATNFNGIKFLSNESQRYIEVYPKNEISNEFKEKGVLYADLKLRLLPCVALEGNGKIIHVNLSDLPIVPKKELVKGIHTYISKFGTILDVGLNYEREMGWFMGSGYVVLRQEENYQEEYPELHRIIPWGEDEYCHATYTDMPVWCRYCHEEGHTKYGCKKAMANILCYACDQYGHKQSDCPKPKSNRTQKNRFYKNARKTPLLNSEEIVETLQVSKEVNNPSSELHQSKWAPNQTSQGRDNNKDSKKDKENKDEENKDEENKDEENKDEENKDEENKDEENKDEENKDEENKDEKQMNEEGITDSITIYNEDVNEIMKDIADLDDVFSEERDNNEDGNILMYNGYEISGNRSNSSGNLSNSLQPKVFSQLQTSPSIANHRQSSVQPQYLNTQLRNSAHLAQNGLSHLKVLIDTRIYT